MVLEYKRWDKFLNVIDKAKEACKNSGINEEDHFSHVEKMIELAKTAQREIDDIMLSRYAQLEKEENQMLSSSEEK